VQSISGYGAGWIGVGGEKITSSVVIGSRGERLAWNCKHFDDLDASHFEQLAALQPELVIFGSGQQIRFPQGLWIKSLIEQQIGLETMDTRAACRTYNVLAGEGRKVIAALLIETT
jgi:uncharacterized protein